MFLYTHANNVQLIFHILWVFVFSGPQPWPWPLATALVPGPNLYLTVPVLNLYLLAPAITFCSPVLRFTVKVCYSYVSTYIDSASNYMY